ncbi:hypothetical protein FLP41_01710 (plasmid) [Paracoccus marcusii]|uniref:hypothetical protein n=1 Tax=Paracoccus marcusii TaxID=59779 RepID=UPI002ED3653E|nr:hypothetical protein FLP41_01710 [Paracoccus marcusii]
MQIARAKAGADGARQRVDADRDQPGRGQDDDCAVDAQLSDGVVQVEIQVAMPRMPMIADLRMMISHR